MQSEIEGGGVERQFVLFVRPFGLGSHGGAGRFGVRLRAREDALVRSLSSGPCPVLHARRGRRRVGVGRCRSGRGGLKFFESPLETGGNWCHVYG
jgi:hypothetical protein